MDNVFTSTYSSYLLVIDQYFALTNSDDLLIRFRTGGSSGTDASANHYSGSNSNVYNSATITNFNYAANAAMALVTQSDTVQGIGAALYFTNIGGVSAPPQCFGHGTNSSNQTYFSFMGYNAAGSTTTGLRFNSTSSNIYLKASLYGLAIA